MTAKTAKTAASAVPAGIAVQTQITAGGVYRWVPSYRG
jgi:hypothetical protein